MKSDNHIAQPQAKSNEWYTPARYIEAAREVMGGIDLDPASCELANQTVKASRFYTKEDDGLEQEWHGRVYCNPPFTTHDRDKAGLYKSSIGLFSAKALKEYTKGNAEQIILLAVPNIDTKWFQPLWEYPICFTNHRVRFNGPRSSANPRNTNRPIGGAIFVYLGPHEQKFINTFSEFGTIAKRVSPPKSAPSTLWEVQR